MTILVVEGVAKVYRKSGNITVADKEGNRVEVSIPDLELVVLIGERIQVTSSAMITLLSQGIPLVVLSGKSDTWGILFDTIQVGSVNIREVQYHCFSDSHCRLKYAKPIIYSKLKGLYNIVKYECKYYGKEIKDSEYIKDKMREIINSMDEVDDINELRKLESIGSKYAWNLFTNLIPEHYGFTGRKPRCGDAINSSLDYLYALIYGIITKGIVTVGLDPYYGLIHATRAGRLSLTYDLSEILKPIAIHTVIQSSRKARLKTFRGSRYLKPRTLEILTSHLYKKLMKETEKLYKRKSIWYLAVREANKFKDSIMKQITYKPYIYDPSS